MISKETFTVDDNNWTVIKEQYFVYDEQRKYLGHSESPDDVKRILSGHDVDKCIVEQFQRRAATFSIPANEFVSRLPLMKR